MRRTFSLSIALILILTMMPMLPAQAAGPWWQSAYIAEVTQYEYPFDENQGFFLADCSYNGVPELYYFVYENGNIHMRLLEAEPNNHIYGEFCDTPIGKVGSDIYVTMHTKRTGGYVWTIDTVSTGLSGTVDEDARMYIEPHFRSNGTLYLTQMFRQVIYTNNKRAYYVKGKKTSSSSYKKALKAYESKLDDTVYFSCYDDYGLAYATRGNFSSVFNGVCSSYLSTIRSMYSVTEIDVSKAGLKLKIGQSYPLKAYAVPRYAPDQGSVSWSSNNTSIASVSNDGVVTAVNPGTAVVYGTINGISGLCAVTVVRPSAKKVSIAGMNWVGVDDGIYLTATVSPTGASQTVKWSTSNKKIATVNSSGLVMGKKAGTVRITARTPNGKKASKIIKVRW